jgi:hypothetical protein
MKLYFAQKIYEGDGRSIEFQEPVWVDVYHIDRKEKVVYFEWSFGMDDKIALDCFIVRDVERLKDKIIKMCEFHLFHAFFHYDGDPNYMHRHWALYGNLKDIVICEENYE